MTRPQQGYAPVDSIYPHKGINTLDPATLSSPQFSPYMVNMVATDGLITTRTGYFDLGNNVDDPVMEIIEWTTENEARQLLAITTKYQFKFDSSTDKWINVSREGTIGTVVNTYVGVDTIKLTGDVVSTHGSGVYFRITGSTGGNNDMVFKSTGASLDSGNTVIDLDTTVNEATMQAVAGETSDVLTSQAGDITNPIDFVVGTDDTNTYLFVTNGNVDKVLWYDGAGGQDGGSVDEMTQYKPTNVNSGNGLFAFTVALHFNHLIFGNFKVASDKHRYLLWSNNGNFQLADGFASGVDDTSSELLLPDSQGQILKLDNLGDRMAIYSENSIGLLSFVGGLFTFSYEQVLRETRLLSPRGIANLGAFHLYMSENNIYLFDGTRLIREIGSAIQGDFRGSVKLDLANQAFAFHDTPKNEVYFVVPIADNATRIYLVEYDLFDIANTRWTPHAYADQITSMGFFTRGDEIAAGTGLPWNAGSLTSTTWTGTVATQISQTLQWNAGTIREGFPVRILGSQDGQVSSTDGVSQSDDGTVVESEWQSIDFTVPQVYASEFARWIDLDIELLGSKVTIEVSTDAGAIWTTVVTDQALTGVWTRYKFPIDVFGETCRVRISTNGGFSLKWLRLWLRPGGAR